MIRPCTKYLASFWFLHFARQSRAIDLVMHQAGGLAVPAQAEALRRASGRDKAARSAEAAATLRFPKSVTMELWHLLLVSLSAMFSLAVAQTTDPLFDPSLCNPGSGVQFTACNSFEDVLSNCTSQQTNQGLTQCMCNQAYFSLIVE
jgi:hypothetical protein